MHAHSTGPKAITWIGVFEPNCVQRIQNLKRSTIKAVDRFNLSFCKIVPMGNKQYSIDVDGSIENFEKIKDYIKSVNTQAEIYVTLGGTGASDSFPDAVSDPNFPSEVLGFLRQYDLDGIDIDWEDGINKTTLSRLCQTLYETLNRNGKGLTLCAWPSSVESYYDPEVLEHTTNGLLVMSYGPDCNIQLTMKEYRDNGFHFSSLAPSIISEGGDNIMDTLEPFGGSIAEKANFARDNQCVAGCSWQLNNDSCTQDNPDLPTGIRSDYYVQYLKAGNQKDKQSSGSGVLADYRIRHIRNVDRTPAQGSDIMSALPPLPSLSVDFTKLMALPTVLVYGSS